MAGVIDNLLSGSDDDDFSDASDDESFKQPAKPPTLPPRKANPSPEQPPKAPSVSIVRSKRAASPSGSEEGDREDHHRRKRSSFVPDPNNDREEGELSEPEDAVQTRNRASQDRRAEQSSGARDRHGHSSGNHRSFKRSPLDAHQRSHHASPPVRGPMVGKVQDARANPNAGGWPLLIPHGPAQQLPGRPHHQQSMPQHPQFPPRHPLQQPHQQPP
eukprot:CAMPEP_0118930008 /NCGR_PEP_ID=MMETSP1169-20130426/6841_1 /TAXON_ID=36882 /ORGANISM="Pyramimonas obovata, Strain CCMP722" /LENGTH=215 /DNA_ID=CAMNT_0006872297 /DNA_START=143 /DNA_END=786 /DNA_ORIENTATION=+